MFGSKTCSAVTRTARALTASKGTLSVVASGRITPLPTKRTCGLVLANSSLNSRMPMSFWPERLRMAGSSVSVTSPTTSSLRYSVIRLVLIEVVNSPFDNLTWPLSSCRASSASEK